MPAAASNDAREFVNIMRPPAGLDDLGRRVGAATTIAANVPCQIVPVRGRELEVARQNYADTTHRVTQLAIDPAWGIDADCYLVWLPYNVQLFFTQPPMDPQGLNRVLDVYVGEMGA